MAIKHKIKIKNVISDEVKVKDFKSVFKDKTVSDDYKSGGAYKTILSMFAEQLEDKKFIEHCKKFFKGESGDTSGPEQTVTQKTIRKKK